MAQIDMMRILLELWDGGVSIPPTVEQAISTCAGSDPASWNETLGAAVASDHHDVPRSATALGSLTPARRHDLARQLGWVIATLSSSGRLQQPPKTNPALEAALFVAAFWDENGSFWLTAGNKIDEKKGVALALEVALRSRIARPEVPVDASIWLREQYDALAKADLTEDWEKLGQLLHNTELPPYDLPGRQAVLGLHLLDRHRFVQVTDRANTWTAQMLLEPLPLVEVLRIAVASRSGHVHFIALDMVRRIQKPLSSTEQRALRNLFIRLGHNPDWPNFLAYCNRYPVRFPFLQVAMGQALARCSEQAIEAYVDSLSLTNADENMRVCTSMCLESFRRVARSDRRRMLWSKAYERWMTWNYGAETDETLHQIARGILDYAVMGWLIEFAPKPPLAFDYESAFKRDLQSLEAVWHTSVSTLSSAFFRMMSRYQLYAHADTVSKSDHNWLPDGRLYTPEIANNIFIQRRYGWNGKLHKDGT